MTNMVSREMVVTHTKEFYKGKAMKAVGKNIVIKMMANEESSVGGIIFTDNTKVTLAEVVSIGNDVESIIKVGDQLVVNWGAAVLINGIDGGDVHILHIDQVFAVV